ncbi:MAG: hypothetical protein WBO55_16955 [Rhizobiaceae bacterium]
MRSLLAAMVATLGALALAGVPASANDGSFQVAQACGWYAIVGCARSWDQANADAPAGTYVIDTNQYPNFRNGWFCAADGPYATRDQVPLWQWKQYRSDAYVKSAC